MRARNLLDLGMESRHCVAGRVSTVQSGQKPAAMLDVNSGADTSQANPRTVSVEPQSSRLDSFIRRLTAQRDILNWVCQDLAAMRGPIIELGLGNGRTFDHLRASLPGRRIIAFDRALSAYHSSVPPAGDLVIGEIRQTASAFAGIGAAFVHADIGTGYKERDSETLEWLPALIVSLLGPQGIAMSGLPLEHAKLAPLAMPATVAEGRYHLYRLRRKP